MAVFGITLIAQQNSIDLGSNVSQFSHRISSYDLVNVTLEDCKEPIPVTAAHCFTTLFWVS